MLDCRQYSWINDGSKLSENGNWIVGYMKDCLGFPNAQKTGCPPVKSLTTRRVLDHPLNPRRPIPLLASLMPSWRHSRRKSGTATLQDLPWHRQGIHSFATPLTPTCHHIQQGQPATRIWFMSRCLHKSMHSFCCVSQYECPGCLGSFLNIP